MVNDTPQTAVDRFYTLLHWQLAAQLPRPGGIHKYSKGGLIKGFSSNRSTDSNGNVTWRLTISNGIDYGAFALGFNADGSRRSPRGELEARNFKIIDTTVKSVAKIIAIPTGGKVVVDF